MGLISGAATGLIAAEHVYILVVQMFLWTKPAGRRAFGLKRDFAEQTRVLAANQGLYNGFLAAGLTWSLLHPVPAVAEQLRLFFLGCVVVAGAYGGLSANPRILLLQMLPAAVALGTVVLKL